ncbi:branched-chain amino acid ABC transporter substrate-binding protein [Candidatus Aerophobetes bacterium]|nr:branched-chain amino acid ABC transporter substrate-binding protein [Candidatus Aerophobetes bacterium]
MKIRKRLLIVTLVVSMLLILLSFSSVMAAKKTVTIGLQGPITGPWAYEGEMAEHSCRIAAKLINDKGGILGGRMIELVVADDAGTPKDGVLAAQRLVAQGVNGAVATYGSSICRPSSDIYEKGKMINIGYGVTFVGLTQRGLKYFFRTCGRDDAQGIFFAKYATEVLGKKRIAIMHDNTTFAKGVAEETKKALQEKIKAGKAEIVYYDAITAGEKDYTPSLTKLRDAKPDVWYFTGYYPEGGLLIRQARDLGIDCPFIGSNAVINEDFIKIAGLDVAKGCLMTQEPMPETLPFSESKEFLKAYREKYGTIPTSPWPVYGADALNVIAYAIDKTGSTDSDTLANFLRYELKKSPMPGVTGPVSFTEQGDRVGVPYQMYVVNEKGKIVLYKPGK